MTQSNRHYEIAEAIATAIAAGVPDIAFYGDVRVEGHAFTQQPERGIIVCPYSETEGIGTNESDDIIYNTLIARVAHGLGNDELLANSNWRTAVRFLFHRRRLDIDGNVMVCTVKFGNVSTPRDWEQFNIDKSALQVTCLVRESRIRTS